LRVRGLTLVLVGQGGDSGARPNGLAWACLLGSLACGEFWAARITRFVPARIYIWMYLLHTLFFWHNKVGYSCELSRHLYLIRPLNLWPREGIGQVGRSAHFLMVVAVC